MKVEVTVCGKPFRNTPVGAKLYLNFTQARVLVLLNRVTYTVDAEPVEVPVVEVAEELPPRRRTYRTRQLKAE